MSIRDDDFNPVFWSREKLDRETLAAQGDDDAVHGNDPGLRHYGPDPLGASPSDDQPDPPYWYSQGIERTDGELKRVLWAILGFLVMSAVGIFMAMLVLNINPVDVLRAWMQ